MKIILQIDNQKQEKENIGQAHISLLSQIEQ